MAKPTTSGFTISGLLDRSASIRNDYPVERIPIEEIADHPANAAYSMDEAGIAQLAKSIEEEGLTDLPLVRKLDDGGWQMVSGHRRKAAYALLAKEDEKYAQIPCRVIRGITDEQSVMLLHAANYFVRSLTGPRRGGEPCAGRGGRTHARREPRAFRRAHGGHQGGDHIRADRTQGIGKTIQRQESRAQDRGEAHAPVARGRARTRSRRTPWGSSPIWIPMRRTGSMRHGGRSPWAGRPSSSRSRPPSPPPKKTRRVPRPSPRRRSQAPFARSGATSRRRKKTRRASWTGRRSERSPRRRKGSSEAGRTRAGAPAGRLRRFQQVAYLVYTR
ncbi:MAG: ParB/RepB/Spo0J family partition protein [Eggerthella lenta]